MTFGFVVRTTDGAGVLDHALDPIETISGPHHD